MGKVVTNGIEYREKELLDLYGIVSRQKMIPK